MPQPSLKLCIGGRAEASTLPEFSSAPAPAQAQDTRQGVQASSWTALITQEPPEGCSSEAQWVRGFFDEYAALRVALRE